MKYTVDSLKPKLDDFLPHVLQHAGLDLTYSLHAPENPHPEVENPDVTVIFEGSDLDLLLANRAELLLALEHLSMEAIRLPAEDHSLLSFDANDYRLMRVEELRLSALAAADKVKRTHAPFHFNPMTSRERRVIHLALRDEKELRSESVGSGPARAVVIIPADMPTPPAQPARFGPPRSGSGSSSAGSGGGFRGRSGDRSGGGFNRGRREGGGGRRPSGGGNNDRDDRP